MHKSEHVRCQHVTEAIILHDKCVTMPSLAQSPSINNKSEKSVESGIIDMLMKSD